MAPCEGYPPVTGDSPYKGQLRGALAFSLIWAWINGWTSNRDAGDLRHHHTHYDVTIKTVHLVSYPCVGRATTHQRRAGILYIILRTALRWRKPIWMIVYSYKRYHIPYPHEWATSEVFITIVLETLQWRHNDPYSVSNHQQLDCLFSRLFRLTSNKHQSSTSLAFVRVIHRWPMDFHQKRPVTRKILQSDDVIMKISRVMRGPHCSMMSRCPWHAPLLWSRPFDMICAPSH